MGLDTANPSLPRRDGDGGVDGVAVDPRPIMAGEVCSSRPSDTAKILVSFRTRLA